MRVKRLSLICALAVSALMMSCLSQKVVHEHEITVPDINFPKFPELVRIINDDGSWILPKESVMALSVYYVQIQAAEKNYNLLKDFYENNSADK